MLTVPSTLGIFEREIVEVTKIIHEQEGLMYYDGANMNALLGRVRPGDMGFDVVHINVHKTFATPHGGGGPGAGPVGVKSHLESYLPMPLISKQEESYKLEYNSKRSIGYIKSFYGNSAVLLRAYCYILSLGGEGLRAVSDQSVLASNYLLSLVDKNHYSTPFSPNTPRKHEFVISSSPLKKKFGITAGDIAKAILDSGMHSPTTYFPLIVAEALMVEPTETEPVENLEAYARVLNEIAALSRTDKDRILDSPKNTSIGRLDEYRASHPNTMILNWNKIQCSREKS
jgi:glycine dehydrogenase subunit 2